jgi:hypothetical protein
LIHLKAGIILCCLGLAIFGITEVPTDGVEFDTTDFVIDGSAESLESTCAAAASLGTTYTPPFGAGQSGGVSATTTADVVDPELGEPSAEPSRPHYTADATLSSKSPLPSLDIKPPSTAAEFDDLD